MTETRAVRGFVHPALFYRGRDEYLAVTVPFLCQGLAAGEPAALAAPPAQLDWIRAALGHDADRVVLVDMTEAGRNPGRIIPLVLRAFADARTASRVRIIGEPVWPGRSGLEYPACVQHEALINAAFADREVTILCPYDAAGLDETVLADALTTHPEIIDRTGGSSPSPAYDPWGAVARHNILPPAPHDAASRAFAAGSLADVRAFAVACARGIGVTSAGLVDLELAVAELTANAVLHGAGRGTARLWAEDGGIVCEVHDAGRLTDPLAGRRPAVPNEPHGRGLLLVNRVADLVRIRSDDSGTTIRAYLAR